MKKRRVHKHQDAGVDETQYDQASTGDANRDAELKRREAFHDEDSLHQFIAPEEGSLVNSSWTITE